jgi:hypothetical protein
MVTVALALCLPLATLVAVTVTFPAAGALDGARYRPAEEMVPVVVPPPWIPFTAQETTVFALPVTAAANCTLCPAVIRETIGEIDTLVEVSCVLDGLPGRYSLQPNNTELQAAKSKQL